MLLAGQAQQAGEVSGIATHYVLQSLPNCSYTSPPADGLFVALSPGEYDNAAACGGYLEVHGPDGSVRVEVIDQCPGCAAGHIDLSEAAFSAIAPLNAGLVNITYQPLVNPSLPGPVSLLVKQGITVSTSLGYTTLIALAAPVGPLLGFFLGDRFERKWIIVLAAGAILVCGLIFGQARDSALIIAMGVALTLAANIMSFSFHAYQQELFPTGIRARAAGFVYSWSRLSVIFSSFIIAFVLDRAGAFGVFVFIAAAMGVVMATIGRFGPRTTNLALEKISR